ncbi:interleukin-13 [Rhinolophus sinicus]|uniref:interleukin-13 n=1 Tax=Rhinolophus sinicus TaxID=89399 RepID=UPI003D79AC30
MGLPHCAEQEMGLRDSEGDQACLSATPRMLVGPDPHGRLAWAGWGRPGTPASIQFTVFLLPQASLCNGSMVWHVNLTANWSCAALESLINVSDCRAIQKTQRILKTLCSHKPSAGQVSSQPIRHTKIEVSRFAKDLLRHARKVVRHGKFN